MKIEPREIDEGAIYLAYVFKHKGSLYSYIEKTEDANNLLNVARETLDTLKKQDE